jgi:D-arabinose 1-dehydrogenase-like Zn-dependent alcohol dehydrogenase
MDILRRHGLVVFVAQPPEIHFNFFDLIFKNLTVVGSLHGNANDLRATIDICAKNDIKSELSTFSIDQSKEMVDSVHDDKKKGKSVLVF